MQFLARIAIVLTPFALFAFLTVHDLAPNGRQTVRYTVGDLSPYVNSLLPSERVVALDDVATLVDEPVYFSVEPPSNDFTSVTVGMAFNPQDQPIVELGALTDVRAHAFDFRPMSNKLLEELDWYTTSDGSQTLYSRTELKATLADFIKFPPERSEIATYRATFPTEYRMPSYSPLGEWQEFDVSLRGSHEYVTYIKNETFTLDVMYTDVNRTYGADEGAVRVWNEAGDVVAEEVIADDDNTSEDQRFSDRTTVRVRVDGLPEGVYRVELSGTSDIVWRTLSTTQRYMTFRSRLYIADDVGYLPEPRAIAFVTDGKRFVLETYHADSAPYVVLNSQTVNISANHTQVTHEIEADGVVTGMVPSGDIKLVTEGKFAFSAAAFFEPDPIPLTPFTDLDGVSSIYATVSPVQTVDGWREAEATFALASLAQENGAYKFAISAPGLEELGTNVDVHKIWLEFDKPPMTWRQALREAAARWVRALRKKI